MPSIKTQVLVDESHPELLAEIAHLHPRSRAERLRALATAAIFLMRGQNPSVGTADTIPPQLASGDDQHTKLPVMNDPPPPSQHELGGTDVSPHDGQRKRRVLPSTINAAMT